MTPRRRHLTLGLTVGAAVAVLTAGSTLAAADPGYVRSDIVADRPGHARLTDPRLVNPWGLALGPNSPLWVANNGTDSATLYRGAVPGAPPAALPLVVDVAGGAPTGEVFQQTRNFTVHGPGGSGPAVVLFSSETGRISGWNPDASPTAAITAATDPDAVYKGLSIVSPRGTVLLAAPDFHGGHVDLYDTAFRAVPRRARFADPAMPRGYAPFNVYDAGDRVYVAYAQQDADRQDEVAGGGKGFVDAYSASGRLLRRLVSRGPLNAPWGMTIAPDGFGRFAGALLVGNFGDGRIHAFDRATGRFLGTVRDQRGRPIVIDGLWALQPGNGVSGGRDAVWFSAGPEQEAHGLVGLLRAS
jgi:uncharacterized protein (TIGR03118 family)